VNGYVVTRGGTFGVVERNYTNLDGEHCIVIRWGRLGWLTPAFARDCKQLSSSYEAEARAQAQEWLESLGEQT
jgi:hypothetical protein